MSDEPAGAKAAASSSLVRPDGLVRTPRPVLGDPWPSSVCGVRGRQVGNSAPHDGRAKDRSTPHVIIAYLVDDRNLVGIAMNGWADGEPAWWLNLQAHPAARVDLADGPRRVRARVAEGAERTRLWARWREIDTKLDDYAAMRSSQTAIVILEPVPDPVF